MNFEDKKDQYRDLVNTALDDYINGRDRFNAGYNILRYTQGNWIRTVYANPNEFLEWYPGNPAFVILRLAKRGLLVFNNDRHS